jgi:hypothetical protein
LEPLRERPPAPAVTAAAPRIGARRRESRQMKNEMPPSTAMAPSAITTASVPVKPPPLEELEGVVVTPDEEELGVTGVVVGGAVGAGDWGNPGESGLPLPGLGVPEPWASATVGAPSDSVRAIMAAAQEEVGRKSDHICRFLSHPRVAGRGVCHPRVAGRGVCHPRVAGRGGAGVTGRALT